MNLRERYQEISEFLLSYQDIWKNEIMLLYPKPLDFYPKAWVEALYPYLEAQNLWELTHGIGFERLSSQSLRDYFSTIQGLSTLPQSQLSAFQPPQSSWDFMTLKKQHEISHLYPHIDQMRQSRPIDQIVDIGGGQGHFAQFLGFHQKIKTLSLDLDEPLQKAGDERQLKKWGERVISFATHKLSYPDSVFTSFLTPTTLTTGLHTCGSLACAQIMGSVEKSSSIFNLGCCYHRLEPEFTNLSTEAKKSPLPFNRFALTLASGPYQKVSLHDVNLRTHVKRFRYCFHIFLYEVFGLTEQVTLGNCDEELYYGDFSLYAREQLKRIKMSYSGSDESLNQFQQDPARSYLVEQMISTGLVRDSLSRPLELAILLDRALWLEERGYRAELIEMFDAKQSPRNIALIAFPR